MDTTRSDYLGCYGNSHTKTPNIDSFAAESVQFDNYYTAINNTAPAHLSILSGTSPNRHGLFENLKYTLPPEIKLLPYHLRAEGYKTYGVAAAFFLGKDWIHGLGDEFDWFVSPEKDFWTADTVVKEWNMLLRNRIQKSSTSFFVWLHFFDPHMPYEPPPEYEAFYNVHNQEGELIPNVEKLQNGNWLIEKNIRWTAQARALYNGEISYMDHEIGKVLDSLRTNSLEDNTIVILVSDHGELLGEHSTFFEHGTLYDNIVHVPFLIRWKEFKPQKVQATVSAVDIAPTVLDLAGIQPPDVFEGKSLAYSIKSAAWNRRTIYAYHAHNTGITVINLPYKLIEKAQTFPGGPGLEFFNLNLDPMEQRSDTTAEPLKLEELRKIARQEWKGMPLVAGNDLTQDELDRLRALGYTQP